MKLSGLGTDLGELPPRVVRPLPGPVSEAYVETLARTECPAFTQRRARRAEQAGSPRDPIVWTRARGVNVVDVDGNIYVDFTSGFGATALGHAHPRIVNAVRRQSGRLVHALGDLHPSDVKINLLERLAALGPWPDARVILGLSGADAVEAALKTAVLATGRAGVIAFEHGYHGLSYGTIAACGYSPKFREPFRAQLNPALRFCPFPAWNDTAAAALAAVEASWGQPGAEPIGAVLVEPIQGRGGVHVPPPGFLAGLKRLCEARGALLIADEVLTGLWRTGNRWASVEDGAIADLVCVGKALGGGLPISACLGAADVMECWGDPVSEAIHTGTFFGHPLACAAAIASLEALERDPLPHNVSHLGTAWMERLAGVAQGYTFVREVRGRGLLAGLELTSPRSALRLAARLLERGYLTLAAGRQADVLQLMPPLVIEPDALERFAATLDEVLSEFSIE